MHNTKSRSFNGGAKHVLLWKEPRPEHNELVHFEEAKNVFPPEVERGWALGAGAADLDGDLLPELYFAHDFGPGPVASQRIHAGPCRIHASPGTSGLHDASFKRVGKRFIQRHGRGFCRFELATAFPIFLSATLLTIMRYRKVTSCG